MLRMSLIHVAVHWWNQHSVFIQLTYNGMGRRYRYIDKGWIPSIIFFTVFYIMVRFYIHEHACKVWKLPRYRKYSGEETEGEGGGFKYLADRVIYTFHKINCFCFYFCFYINIWCSFTFNYMHSFNCHKIKDKQKQKLN